jgi:hypothetical protein
MICNKMYLLAKHLVLPWLVLKSQVVVRKEKPKEEGQDGETVVLKCPTVGIRGGMERGGMARLMAIKGLHKG